MTNKILLVYPKTGVEVLKPQSPLSLLTLCPGLIANGFEPIIVDMRLPHRNPEEIIRRHISEALFVGISTMTGHQIRYALDVAAFVRELDPDMKLVWGGIHPSLLPEETIADPLVDIVAIGEGEETIIALAQAIAQGENLESVPGLLFEKNGQLIRTAERPLLDLETLHTPSWDLVDVEDYSEIGVQAGRGCPWQCRFCYNMHYNKRKWRAKNVHQIMEELHLLANKYNVRQVTFYDDNFFSSPSRVRALAERMIEDKLDIRWSTTCRADYLAHYDDEFIKLLKDSGVHILYVGSESGSQRILDYINKGITVDDILGMARTTNKHELRVHTSFMLGFTIETADDRQKTFEVMDKIRAIDKNIYITTTCIYTPYPGNDMFHDAVNAGFIPPKSLTEWGGFSFFECRLPWLNDRDTRQLESLAFITRFVFWHREIKSRYLRWYFYPFYYFLRFSALVRWKARLFDWAVEWKIFSMFVKKLAE